MTAPSPLRSEPRDESQLMQALQEYRAAREAGIGVDRGEFLAGHAEIAQELAQCLAALDFVYEAAPKFQESASEPSEKGLAEPIADASDTPAHLPLGDYQIVREIGRGGMGVVYEAIQLSLGRRVALKVLPFASTLDAKQLQRFKNEAQAAAGLHHTNIVPVFATGSERGVHYYAMQFIEGQTLAFLIQELRHSRSESPRQPGPELQRGSRIEDRGSKVGDRVSQKRGSQLDQARTASYAPKERVAPEGGVAHPATSIEGSERTARESTTVNELATAIGTAPVPPRSSLLDSRSSGFFRTVANLGIQAAEAMEHAHQLGVIHRDIKPANLMVETGPDLAPRGRGAGGEGLRLWITDFGLAHCQGGCELTMSGDLLGTLRYMSPEQALAKRVIVDERTDIYSLGVTLFELLTLEPAFPGTDRQELLRQIAFEEPRPPRRLNAGVPPELETIVLKAIEKNPADRYATAQEFADDLRRFLEDKPIRARRPTLGQRARKWARRHPGVAWMTATLLVVVAVGSAVSAVIVTEQLHEAERLRKEAQKAFDEAFVQVSESKLIDVPGTQPLRQQLLLTALRYYQDFLEQHREDAAVQADLVAAHFRVATLHLALDESDQAVAAIQQGLDLVNQLRRAHPDDREFPLRLAGFVRSVRRLHYGSSLMPRPAQDEQTLVEAIRLWQEFTGEYPDQRGFRSDLALLHHLHAESLAHQGRSDEALAAFQITRALAEELAGLEPSARLYAELLKRTYSQMEDLLGDQRRLEECERILRAAVTFFEHQVTAYPPITDLRFHLAVKLNDLGDFLGRTDRANEAETTHRRAIAILERLVAEEPTEPDYRFELHYSHRYLAALLHLRRPHSAESFYHQAIDMGRQLTASFPTVPDYLDSWATALAGLGDLLARQGRFHEAEDVMRQVVRLKERFVSQQPGDPGHLSKALWHGRRPLIWLLLARGRPREVEPLLKQSQKQFEETLAAHPTSPMCANCLADVWRVQAAALTLAQRPEEAEVALRACSTLLRKQPGWARNDRSTYDGTMLFYDILIFDLLDDAGRYADCEALRRQQIKLQTELAAVFPENVDLSERLARNWRDLGDWLSWSRRPSAAVESYRSALAGCRNMIQRFPAVPLYERQRAEVVRLLGQRLTDISRHDEAAEVYRQALGEQQRLALRFPQETTYRRELATLYRLLGQALWAGGEPSAAERAFHQDAELCQRLAAEFPADLPACEERAHSLRWLAIFLQASRPDDAEQFYREALPLLEELVHRAPEREEFRYFIADTYRRLGELFINRHRPREAELCCRQAFALFQELSAGDLTGPWVVDHMRVAYQQLIDLLSTTERPGEAQRLERRAIDHYQKLLDAAVVARPKDWQIWQARARFHARRREFTAAAADMEHAILINPDDDGARFEYAGFLLLAGDSAAYKRWCAREQERLGASPDLTEHRYPTYDAARTFALAAGSGVEPALMVRLAEEAVGANPNTSWMLHTLAFAQYRAGELRLAIERAQQSLQGSPWSAPHLNWLLLALVHHQIGHVNEARHWLDKGARAVPDDIFRDTLHPYDWLESQILLREAKALLGMKEEKTHHKDTKDTKKN